MKKTILLLGLLAMVIFVGCDKAGDPHDHHDHSVITTLRLTFTEVGNPSNTFTVAWSDPDGLGGNPATIDTLYVTNGTNYTVSFEVWNESVTPTEDVTQEIIADANEHIVCYYAMNGFDATISITDQDANSLPLGLATDWTINAAANGDVRVNLRHQIGVKDGTCAPGESDIDVTFPVVVN